MESLMGIEKVEMETSAEALLDCAVRTIRERGKQYGSVIPLFDQIAERWSLTLKVKVTTEQVALCMIDLKVARINNGSTNMDNAVDIAGYAALIAELRNNQQLTTGEI